MINRQQVIDNLQSALQNLTEDLIIILGPTASGKTKFAVELAEKIDAEIISVDSRQVYRGMDIGTGKDLSEYKNIPYHLIDILNPGEKYNVSQFRKDFDRIYLEVKARGRRVIACGGTGFYLQSLLEDNLYAQVPIDENFRVEHIGFSKEKLLEMFDTFPRAFEYNLDRASKKRIIRALEIFTFLDRYPDFILGSQKIYSTYVIGLNPGLEDRRTKISNRLLQRLKEGMVEEVEMLVQSGVSFKELEYYGLEYKYISYYLKGDIGYEDFYKKLETEIHRYAKRQMTYFRKMEKDGVEIHWF